MKILVTGHDGYLGTVLTPFLAAAGHEVVGLDLGLFEDCAYGAVPSVAVLAGVRDVRDVREEHLDGIDAIMHLAAISNDPVGDLDAGVTLAINHRATVRLAQAARRAAVSRFVLSSSCSSYGAADSDVALDEHAAFNPVTPYGESKVLAERDLRPLAGARFSPVFLRNATAYGLSPRLRGDLVVHNLLAYAHTTGEVRLQSDGRSWRPFAHVEDISRAFLAAVEAPREAIHAEAFNVGRAEDNLQIRGLARMVEATVPHSRVTFAPGAAADRRSYRVSFAKAATSLPGFEPQWTVQRGIDEVYAAYRTRGLTLDDFESSRFQRIKRVLELQAAGRVDDGLRRRAAVPAGA